jgi:NTE family protein
MAKQLAVILAGAVAKGAFEAGVLEVLTEQLPADVKICRVVGASSGALNATLLASGVHAGKLREVTAALAKLWREEGGILNAFHLNLGDVVHLRGLSDQARLRALLQEHIQPIAGGQPIELKIVLAPLSGAAPSGGTSSSFGTTYEAVLSFSQRDFESQAALNAVFDAAVASAAFPVLFAPARAGTLGPCIDGGVVNNTPIKYAVEQSAVDTVVIIAPTVAEVAPGEFDPVTGGDLLGHVSDMLINERLHRDLKTASQVNDALTSLDALVSGGQLSIAQLVSVKQALGWSQSKQLRIIPIRPLAPLPGNSFSAFGSRPLRAQYVELGQARAHSVLDGMVW